MRMVVRGVVAGRVLAWSETRGCGTMCWNGWGKAGRLGRLLTGWLLIVAVG